MKFYILALTLIMLLSSCSLINEEEGICPVVADGELIHLSFKMVASDIRKTRADNADHEEVNSEFPDFENRINADDLAFFIYALNSNDNSWNPVLTVTDLSTSTQTLFEVNGTGGVYQAKLTLSKSELSDIIGHEISKTSGNPVQFRIVFVANAGSGHDYESLDATSYSSLINDLNEWRFNVNNIYTDAEENTASEPTVADAVSGGIPMFGTATWTTTERALCSSTLQEALKMGDLYLLRSLAKIRVIDNIPHPDPEVALPRIDGVSFEGATPFSYILPSLTGYVNGVQVESPRYATPGEDTSSKNFTLYRRSALRPKLWLGYAPDQAIALGYPRISITVTFAVNEDGTPTDRETYIVPMTEYKDTKFEFGNAILRNHIYTLSVDNVDARGLTLRAVVKPYIEISLSPEFGYEEPKPATQQS